MHASDRSFVTDYLAQSLAAARAFAEDAALHEVLAGMAETVVGAMRAGCKLLIAGNGGSAGDAQHIAGEFIARLMYDRAPLPAIALTTDSSVITATGNDYGYDAIFERQILGLGQKGDVFLGISTSGRSPNVLRAFDAARARGLATLGFTGAQPGQMGEKADLLFKAPAGQTAIIQQIHISAAHVLCALVERAMYPRPAAP